MDDRGGTTLTTGTIGRLLPLRQTLLLPGESMDVRVSGTVKMEALRERDALRIHAHLAHFMTPVRWLWSGWPQYIKDGPTGATSPPTETLVPNLVGLGGDVPAVIQQWWRLALLRIYNEWYKHPEAADATAVADLRAVNLEHSWTRCRDTATPDDTADYTVGSGSNFTVQDLAEVQARFRSAVQREVLSFERYQEVLREAWGADGSREVDQVPIKLGDSSLGVDPRSIPATDAAGLGQWASMYDFGVNDQFEVTAPDHAVLTSILVVRMAPIAEERHPLANDRLSWAEMVGDPSILAASAPVEVQARDIFDTVDTASLGFLPAGWQWRAGNNIIGSRIDVRNSFPYMRIPTSASEARDSTLRTSAFRSSALDDYVADLYFNMKSSHAIPNALSSYYSGQGDAGRGNSAPYPKQGRTQ